MKREYPKDWDEKRIKRVVDHYEDQSEDEAIAEDEAAWEDTAVSLIHVLVELVPEVRAIIARHKKPA